MTDAPVRLKAQGLPAPASTRLRKQTDVSFGTFSNFLSPDAR